MIHFDLLSYQFFQKAAFFGLLFFSTNQLCHRQSFRRLVLIYREWKKRIELLDFEIFHTLNRNKSVKLLIENFFILKKYLQFFLNFPSLF
jgi:hypothetical protein